MNKVQLAEWQLLLSLYGFSPMAKLWSDSPDSYVLKIHPSLHLEILHESSSSNFKLIVIAWQQDTKATSYFRRGDHNSIFTDVGKVIAHYEQTGELLNGNIQKFTKQIYQSPRRFNKRASLWQL